MKRTLLCLLLFASCADVSSESGSGDAETPLGDDLSSGDDCASGEGSGEGCAGHTVDPPPSASPAPPPPPSPLPPLTCGSYNLRGPRWDPVIYPNLDCVSFQNYHETMIALGQHGIGTSAWCTDSYWVDENNTAWACVFDTSPYANTSEGGSGWPMCVNSMFPCAGAPQPGPPPTPPALPPPQEPPSPPKTPPIIPPFPYVPPPSQPPQSPPSYPRPRPVPPPPLGPPVNPRPLSPPPDARRASDIFSAFFILWVVLVPIYAIVFIYWVRYAWNANAEPLLNGLIAPEKAAVVIGTGALIADIIRLVVYLFVTFLNGEITFFGEGDDRAWTQLVSTLAVDVVIFVTLLMPCCGMLVRTSKRSTTDNPATQSNSALSNTASMPPPLLFKPMYMQVTCDEDHERSSRFTTTGDARF